MFKKALAFVLVVAVSFLFTSSFSRSQESSKMETKSNHQSTKPATTTTNNSLFFTENRGQWNSTFSFIANVPFGHVGLSQGAIYYDMVQANTTKGDENKDKDNNQKQMGHVMKLELLHSNPVKAVGYDPLPHKSNFFLGNDSSKWATDVPNYRKIIYEDIWKGIDLVYYFNQAGLKYEFRVKPEGNLKDIQVKAEGATVNLKNNQLEFQTSVGSIYDTNLKIFTEKQQKEIKGKFVVNNNIYTFNLEDKRPTETFVIDPLVYSTFVGGSGYDSNYFIEPFVGKNTIDVEDGYAYVTGYTSSEDFPTTAGAYKTTHDFDTESGDIFVFKLSTDGTSLVYSTYIGGSEEDESQSIKVKNGIAYVCGRTLSLDFPFVQGGYDTSFIDHSKSGFILFVNSNGSSIFTTRLGEADCLSIDVNDSDKLFVTGNINPTIVEEGPPPEWYVDFPTTTNAFDSSYNGSTNDDGSQGDAFLSVLPTNLTELFYSTFIGGNFRDIGYSVKVKDDVYVYICGETDSKNFPITCGVYQPVHHSETDAFVLEFDFSGLSETPPEPPSLEFSTFVGGNRRDQAFSVDVDSSNNIYCTGSTGTNQTTNQFPTTPSVYNETYNGGSFDAFVFKLDSDGSTLLASTFVGGAGLDKGISLSISSEGIAVTGFTQSENFPTTNDAYDNTFNAGNDAFVLCFETDLTDLVYSSYFGDEINDQGYSIKSVGSDLYVTGVTDSPYFPVTTGSYDENLNGDYDIFVFKLSI
jgi:hypothetical protein